MKNCSLLIKLTFLLLVFTHTPPLFAQNFKENKTNIGEYLLSENRYKEALEVLNSEIENSPNHKAYYLRGRAKYNLGDKVGAEFDFTEAITRRANILEYYLFRASTRAFLLKNDKAFNDFEKAIDLDKTNEYIYLATGDTDDNRIRYAVTQDLISIKSEISITQFGVKFGSICGAFQ